MAKLKKNSTDELKDVVSQIEDEGMRTLNDSVEVGEDGLVHDVPLLAGYLDENGILHDTFTYREMNGADEEAISNANVRSNGAKLVNVLCERCVVQIGTLTKKECGVAKWGQIIRSMLGGDLDYMAFKIREISKGGIVKFTHKCPQCGTKLVTEAKTDEFPIKPFLGQREIEFTLKRGYRDKKGDIHYTGKIRLANGLDREFVTPAAKKNPSTAVTLLLTRLVTFDDGAFVTTNGIKDMYLSDRSILEDIVKDNVFGIDTVFNDLMCDNCGCTFDGNAGSSDFF